MAKRKKKKKNGGRVIGFIFFLIVLVILGVISYPSYKKSLEVKSEAENLKQWFNETIPNEISENIELKKDSDYYEISFSSSDSDLLNIDGKVSRPLYSEGNKNVEIKMNCKVKNLSFIDSFVFNILKTTDFEEKKNVKVLALPISDKDKLDSVINELFVPSVIMKSMSFPQTINKYEDISINWSSDNESILSSNGEIIGIGECKVICTLELNDEVIKKEYKIKTVNSIILDESDYDFSDYSDDEYKESSFDKVLIGSSLEENEKVKFKVNSEADASIKTIGLVKSCNSISFKYEYAKKTNTSYTKDSYITLFTSTDNENYVERKKEILNDDLLHTFTYDFDGKDYYVKVCITTDYSEKFIYLDDFKITRFVSSDDIISSIAIPNSLKENVILPFTTIYGGKLEYSSDSTSLTNTGVVTLKNEKTDVNLRVNVIGFDDVYSFNKIVKVMGLKEVTPVEIRFIDVGKYGHSDCGESILIKYGNTEVLIDAGDRYADTYKAVTEVLDSNITDDLIEYVIATHPDSDHIGSMDDVINNYNIGQIITFNGTASSTIYDNFAKAISDKEDIEVCKVSDSLNNVGYCQRTITLGEEVFIEIIDTKNYDTKENNSRSIVCVLNAYGVRTLFTGDADNNSSELEKAYMNTVGDIDILKMVHHGTREGTTSDYLKAIDPEYVVVCNGNYFGNKHGHPTYEALSRVYDYDNNIKVFAVCGGDADNCYVTSSGSYKCDPTDFDLDRNGTITLVIDNNGYSFSSVNYNDNVKEIRDTEFWKARSLIK